MRTILPVSGLVTHEAQIRFVYQGSRLKGMTRALVSQLESRQATELVDDEWNQSIGCLRIAGPHLLQENGNFASRLLLHAFSSFGTEV